MKIADFSPTSFPTQEEQRDALRKGLGRAMIWARHGKLGDGPLLDACLHDQRFDRQIDERRAGWLWRIMNASGKVDLLRPLILQSLQKFPDECAAAQLCGLAYFYAQLGDQDFRGRLYEIVETKPDPDWKWLGEEEIIALDAATKRLGEGGGERALAGSTDPAVLRFLRASTNAKQDKEGRSPPPGSYAAAIASLTSNDVIAAAEKGNRQYLRGWGRQARPDELQRVVERLFATSDAKQLVAFLQVLDGAPLPTFDSRLIDLCRSSDDGVQRHAFKALAQNSHPAVRAFALTEMQRGLDDGYIAALFEKNYEAGDENLLLEALVLPDDPCELHWLLMDLLGVLEANDSADVTKLARIAYGSTPCEMCRYRAVKLLLQRTTPPEWLLEEYRHDAYEDAGTLLSELGFLTDR